MATVFWGSYGIIIVDNLDREKTMNSEYVTLLQQLSDKIRKKRPHLLKKGVLLHHDDAPAYKSMVAMAKIHK